MSPDNDNGVSLPEPDAQRQVRQLMEKLDLPESARSAADAGVNLAVLFEQLPPEYRPTVAAVLEAFSRVPEEDRDLVITLVRQLVDSSQDSTAA